MKFHFLNSPLCWSNPQDSLVSSDTWSLSLEQPVCGVGVCGGGVGVGVERLQQIFLE